MPKIRVLIIDDFALIRDFIRIGLQATSGQIEILEAANGRYAKAVLEGNPVDIVLCDWEMPDVNGQDLLIWVMEHERLKDLPFVMVTARSERKHVVAALRAGADGYVVKPFSIETLAKQIQSVLARKRGLVV